MARKIKCYSVRLAGLTEITPKAAKLRGFDGSEDIFPLSQIFGRDYNVAKSEAYWIAAWILEKKNLQYSCKKEAWFNYETGKMEPTITVKRHLPEKQKAKKVKPNKNLLR